MARHPARFLGVLLGVGMVVALAAPSAWADPTCNGTSSTLDVLSAVAAEVGGAGCVQIGNVQFTDFTVLGHGGIPDLSKFPVTVMANLNTLGNGGIPIGTPQLTISGSFNVNAGNSIDLSFLYEVGLENGTGTFTDAHLFFDGLNGVTCVSPASPCPGVANITETVFTDTGTTLGSLAVNAGINESAVLNFAPQNELVLMKDISVSCAQAIAGQTCVANFSIIDQAFTSTVPEPATLLLLGSGLAGAGFFGRRRAKKVGA
jgi:hypothetical protein